MAQPTRPTGNGGTILTLIIVVVGILFLLDVVPHVIRLTQQPDFLFRVGVLVVIGIPVLVVSSLIVALPILAIVLAHKARVSERQQLAREIGAAVADAQEQRANQRQP